MSDLCQHGYDGGCPLCEIYALQSELAQVKDALRLRQRKGHHDTCSHSLGDQYECDCGYEAGIRALKKGGTP